MQVAGLAYFLPIQEEEYVQNLPKFYVLEQVHLQLVFAEEQVSYQMIQVEVTSHTLPQLVQAVEQLVQAEEYVRPLPKFHIPE